MLGVRILSRTPCIKNWLVPSFATAAERSANTALGKSTYNINSPHKSVQFHPQSECWHCRIFQTHTFRAFGTTSSAFDAKDCIMPILDKHPRLNDELAKFPKPEDTDFSYGTAGFRTKARLLDSTMFRVGMLALMRSRQQGKVTGVMITASHNPEEDNGAKLVDPDGGMLSPSWEKYAMDLANSESDKVSQVLDLIIQKENIDVDKIGSIFIARDTRKSSEHLAELVREGALLVGGNVLDFGIQTTPQLHHFVRMFNFDKYNKNDWASETGYYNMLVAGYKKMLDDVQPKPDARGVLIVDAAHGVGALQFAKLAEQMKGLLRVEIRNGADNGILNEKCGAEFVQKARSPPENFHAEQEKGKRCCSFDGDADRVVYHYFDEDGSWHLLDGDKIASLFAAFVQENLKVLGLDEEVKLGVVQTAYANGAATKFIQDLKIAVDMAKTGVKFVHHKAEDYDIGIYFEGNGHGTILFQDNILEKLQQLEGSLTEETKKTAVSRLLGAAQVINQAVGDAMSDALMVEAVLAIKGWTVKDWDNIYRDLPSRQTKLAIKDRTVIRCNEDETAAIAPEGLQEELDAAAKEYIQGRTFVRPSGTEDVVRIYAEAASQEEADALALRAAQTVHKLCDGLGEAPTAFTA